jgi:hypothetical protein
MARRMDTFVNRLPGQEDQPAELLQDAISDIFRSPTFGFIAAIDSAREDAAFAGLVEAFSDKPEVVARLHLKDAGSVRRVKATQLYGT